MERNRRAIQGYEYQVKAGSPVGALPVHAGLLAAASSIIVAACLLSPTPARAACAPGAGNGVTATCSGVSNNLNGDNGYGTGSEQNVTLTVAPGATVSGDVNGISLGAGAHISTSAGSRVEGVEAGIQVNGGGAVVDIAGTVASDWFGVKLGSGEVNLAEGGTITVSNDSLTDEDYGAAILIGEGAVVDIAGDVTASGLLIQGIAVERQTPGSAQATRITIGATGSVSTDGDFASAISIFGGEENTAAHSVTVHGRIATTGDHAFGIDTREVIDGDPIRADTTILMTGTLETSGKGAHGIFSSVSEGSDSPITISGDVRTGGEAAHAVLLGLGRGGAGVITVESGGIVEASGADALAIALSASGENQGLASASVTIAEGARVASEHGPAIGFIDDPEMPADPAIGRVDTHLIIAGTVARPVRGDTAVLLGAGDDRVTLLPTYDVTGVIDGGAGFDTFVLDGAAGTTGQIDLVPNNTARVTGFEDIRKTGAGSWRITGTVPSSLILPAGTVEAGTLIMDAVGPTLDLTVNSGATLAGSGRLGDVTIRDGGRLAPGNSPGVLSVEALTLSAGSILDFELGAPSVAAASDRIDVAGALVLDGVLNVTNVGGFGNGVYTLINYGTLLADNGLAMGAAPSGYSYAVNAGTGTASAVTLAVSGGEAGPNQYWDGANTTPGGTLYGRGGAGVWNGTNGNWTDTAGTANGPWGGGQFAIFYNGTGTVTVEGAQTVTGLQFAANGYRLTAGTGGALHLTGAENRVRVDPGSTATLALPVTADGDLVKDGAGTLALAGPVEVAGGLHLAEGRVRVDAGAAVEAGDAFAIGVVTGKAAEAVVSGAGAVIEAQFANVGATANGTLNISDGGRVTMRDNSLIGWGTGTVGEATVTGRGSTWTSGGYLAVGNSGHGTLVIADGGAVESTGTASSGSGGSRIARHAGSVGTAHVAGATSYWNAGDNLIVGYAGDGTLRLSNGGRVMATRLDVALEGGSTGHVIIGGDGAPAGTVVADDIVFGDGDGTLTFDHSGSYHPFAARLSGAGALDVRAGVTVLTGDSAGFAGTTTVHGGTLMVGGADGAGTLGGTRLTVGTAGTLRGLGAIVGDVTVSGRLMPGAVTATGANQLGALSVTGDVAFDPGATFGVRIAGNGDTDSLSVTGGAAVAGDVAVTAIDAATSYRDGQTYTILSASDGVTGTFNDPTMMNHSAFIAPELSYVGNDVLLTIAVTRDFTTVAETANQREAAGGLFSFDQTAGSDALAVFNAVAVLNAEDARRAFDHASGELHAASQYAVAEAADLFTRTIQRRTGMMPALPAASAPWLAVLGQSGHHDGDGNAARLSSRTYGLAGGIDLASGSLGGSGVLRLGLAAGYLDGRATVAGRGSKADFSSKLVGAYLSLGQGALHLSNAFSLGWHDLDTQRRITLGALDRTAQATRDARTIGYSATLRYDLAAGGVRLSPLATLDIANVRLNAVRETGADALNLALVRENFTTASVGAGAELGFGGGASPVSGSVRVLYDHQIGDTLPRQRAAFGGGTQSYTVLGPRMRDGGISAGAGLAYRLSEGATISASYDGAFNKDANNHRGNLALTIGF